MLLLSSSLVSFLLLSCASTRAEILPDGHETDQLSPALMSSGNNSSFLESAMPKRSLFARQCVANWGLCPQGQCCPQNSRCCLTTCMAEGNFCCPGPTICPPDWNCCGNQGGCKPKNAICCNDRGEYCAAGSYCIAYNGRTDDIRCRGSTEATRPPTAINTLSIPTVRTTPQTTAAGNPITTAPPQSVSIPTATYITSYTYSATWSYWFPTYFYTTIVRTTKVTYTVTTVTTVLTVYATDASAANTSLTSLGSAIFSYASSSASAARPPDPVTASETVVETTTARRTASTTAFVTATVTQTAVTATSSGAAVGMVARGAWSWDGLVVGLAMAEVFW